MNLVFQSRVSRWALAALAATLWPSGAALAEPLVKAVNFTAAWCPNCRVLNPRLEEALQGREGEVAYVPVDMTDLRGKGEARKWERVQELKALTEAHQVRYLWDWYGGYTGLAIFVAADTGEPLSCVMADMDVEEMAGRLKQSLVLAQYAPPGARRPDGPDCPPPMRPQK